MTEAAPAALIRDAGPLQRSVDLLVVGGGIYGAYVAWDAALRGLSVAIIEAGDWGGGTSSASSKLIHGGLRYLEYGQLGLVRSALSERSHLLRNAPHRVHPLRFLVPIWRDSRMRPWQLTLGLTMYDVLAGVHGVSSHRRLGRSAIQRQCPFLNDSFLQNGFSYLDAGEDDARYVLEIISGAVAAGACAVNRCRMRSLIGGERIEGALVHDAVAQRDLTIRASVTVCATGAWLPEFAAAAAIPLAARLNKGVHLVMPPLPPGCAGQALLLTARSDQRVFFLIPWYGATLLGTTDADWQGDPARVQVEHQDIDYLLGEVAGRCPGLGWTRRDVRGVFAGLRTLQAQPGRSASAATREWTLLEPRPHLLLPIGGKLTSARVDAGIIVDRACQLLQRRLPIATQDRPLPWTPRDHPLWLRQATVRGEALGLDRELAETMANRHGRMLPLVHALITADASLGARIHPQVPLALAEALHAVRSEMAQDLADVLRRRVPAIILAPLALAQIERVASVIASTLLWDAAHAKEQAQAYWQLQEQGRLRLCLRPSAGLGGGNGVGGDVGHGAGSDARDEPPPPPTQDPRP